MRLSRMGFSCKFAVNFLLAVFVLCTYHHLLESSPLSIDTDKEALVAFKSQISIEPPKNPLSNWDQNLSPCNWAGVSCSNQRVVGLNLSGLGMTGSISPYIGNLSFLASLELQNNALTGILPHHLCNLLRLRVLNLSFNRMEGTIPSNISRWKDLRIFDIQQNRISGKLPQEIDSLTHLQVLNLASNNLSGDLPSSLTNISSLVELNFNTNNLGGLIPFDLDHLVNLKFLDLTSNNFSGRIPSSLYNMSSLEHLALASNNLSGELPWDIGIKLPNLLDIRCCFNKFTGKIPWTLHNLTNIKSIRLTHNRFHGSVPPGLGSLPNLEIYNIGYNNIVNSGQGDLDFLEPLTNSTRLNFLNFEYNLLKGTLPTSIGNLSKVLTKLLIGGNDIYGAMPPSIGELGMLGTLTLSYSSISGEIPSEIGKLKQLTTLTLAYNMLSGKLPDSIGNLTSLTKIDLSANQLVGSIPHTFGNLQRLIFMDLCNNSLNGSIPPRIFSLPELSLFLNLSQNQLTGSLPKEIQLLKNVEVIDISDNNLSGKIPSTIESCKSLQQLSLARNMLSGSIPNTLGFIRGLEILDISSNQLSGPIPLDLLNLHSLQFLNLSFNTLEGKIPCGGVFADPTKTCLINNEKFCSSLSCNNSQGRLLSTKYIITISLGAVISLGLVIGLMYYVLRRRRPANDSFTTFKGHSPLITYHELRAATNNFSEENIIGRGSFGLVYKGLLKGSNIAVKVINTTIPKSQKIFWAECAALRRMKHRNLVKLITVCSSINSKNEEFLAFVLEFMSNGTLDDWITRKRRHEDGMGLSVLERVRIAIGIASAVDYLHNGTEVRTVHCDLKPCNVLMDSEMTPRVADFGLAKLFLGMDNNQISCSNSHTLRGSIGYIPPEYGYGEKSSSAGDVYSYGILLLELFTGKSPTHEMFSGGLSLTSWVQKHFPDNIVGVLDDELSQHINNFRGMSNLIDGLDCTTAIIGVGLSCAVESPVARINIKNALGVLKHVEKLLEKHEIPDSDDC